VAVAVAVLVAVTVEVVVPVGDAVPVGEAVMVWVTVTVALAVALAVDVAVVGVCVDVAALVAVCAAVPVGDVSGLDVAVAGGRVTDAIGVAATVTNTVAVDAGVVVFFSWPGGMCAGAGVTEATTAV
jgi:hypothetical protein